MMASTHEPTGDLKAKPLFARVMSVVVMSER
jgi:hypothetical protein